MKFLSNANHIGPVYVEYKAYKYVISSNVAGRIYIISYLLYLNKVEFDKTNVEKPALKAGFKYWRPHGDSNPGYRRERAMS